MIRALIRLSLLAGMLSLLTLAGCSNLAEVAQAPPTATAVPPTDTPSPVPPTATATATATATPIPSATPTPTITPTPDPALFRDGFDDPGSGWDVGEWEAGSAGYGKGHYYVVATEAAMMEWGSANQEFADVEIIVDATQVDAPPNDNNSFGVMCRMQENGNGYALRISGDGYYAIHAIVTTGDQEEFYELVAWTTSPVINQGNATNQIRAVCDGARLALYVNGELLAEATDDTFAQGDIGLAATSFEVERTEIHFDNLVVLPAETSVAGTGDSAEAASNADAALLRDDFADPTSGWEVGEWDGGSVGYSDGRYFVRSVQDDNMMWGRSGNVFADVVVEVEAVQVAAPASDNNGYGILCRVQENDDGYLLRVSGDGYYSIQLIISEGEEKEFHDLVAWTTSPIINQGNATNQIWAVCDGPRLALFANGELLAETTDDTFAAGDVALTATSYESEPTEVHFDNVVVWPADIIREP